MKRYSIVSGVVSATIALQLVFTSTAAATEPCGDVQVIWAGGAGSVPGDEPFQQFYGHDLAGEDGRIGPGVVVSAYELGTGFGGYRYPAAAGAWEFATAGADWAPYD